MASTLNPDIEAQKVDIHDDATTLNGPNGNAPKYIVYEPAPTCVDDVTARNDPKQVVYVPAPTGVPTRVYAPQSSPDQCGMGTIGFFEINLILQIVNKFLATVGKEEMPEKIRGILCSFMFFCVICNAIAYCCSLMKQKLVLPCFGAQFIRLAGILLFVSCILYGHLMKDDILFTYKYNIESSIGNMVPYLFWFFDVLTAIWLIIVVYRCFAFLHDLNKNYPYSDVYEMF